MLNNWYNTKVTLELREIVESGVKIWDFDYPSYYNGEEKTAFEQKVIDHFYFRQIGQETVGRFLHYFRTKIREIMPYYIDIYHTVELFKSIEDPFQAYDLTETFDKTGTSSSSALGSSSDDSFRSQSDTARNTRKFSDTPQGSIANIDDYMSEATQENNNLDTEETSGNSSTSESSVEGSDSESYTLRRYGNIGVQPLGDEVKKLREAYINVDMMIINELNDLFLKVY